MSPQRENNSKLKRKNIFAMRILRTVSLGLWKGSGRSRKEFSVKPSVSYTHLKSTLPSFLLLRNGKQLCFTYTN
jgi:hypothetical protein